MSLFGGGGSLNAGRVEAVVGYRHDTTGLDEWDRRVGKARLDSQRSIDQRFGADTSELDRRVAGMRAELAQISAMKADPEADLDVASFNARAKILRAEIARLNAMKATIRIDSRDADLLKSRIDSLIPKVGKGTITIGLLGGAGLAAAKGLAALVGGAVSVTSALAPMTGAAVAVPALFAAIGQAAGVVGLAGMKDFTEALGGNEEALKRLTPEAKQFLEELKELEPRYRRLQSTAQEPLFGGLDRGLDHALDNFPILNRIIDDTSHTIGRFVADTGRMLGDREFGEDLLGISDQNNRTLDQMGDATLNIASALRHVLIAGGPFIDWMGRNVVEMSEFIDAEAEAGRESGRLAAWFDESRQALHRFWDIGEATVGTLLNLGRASKPFGEEFLVDIRDGADELERLTGSVEGQNKLREYFKDSSKTLHELSNDIADILDEGSVSDAVARAITLAVPIVAENAGELGLAVLRGLARGFADGDALEKVFTAAAFIRLVGGSGALRSVGVALATTIAKPMATTIAADMAAQAAAAQATGVGSGKWTMMGRSIGSVLGPAIGSVAAVGFLAVYKDDILAALGQDSGDEFWNAPLDNIKEAFSGAEKDWDIGVLLAGLDKLEAGFDSFGDAAVKDTRAVARAFQKLDNDVDGAVDNVNDAVVKGAKSIDDLGSKGPKDLDKVGDSAERNAGRRLPKELKAAERALELGERATDSFQGKATKDLDRTGDATRDLGKRGARNFDGLRQVVDNLSGAWSKGLDLIGGNTKSLLDKLKVDFNYDIEKGGKSNPIDKVAAFLQRGGPITIGAPSGDSVPAMLERGEYVLNRNAVRAIGQQQLDAINFGAAKRFQKGGGVGAMIAEANRFERASFPYEWGGGHGSFGIQPVDCSGAVSDVLHAGGLLDAPMTSGSLMSWGQPARGSEPLVVYANPVHTVMSIAGRVFGTSGSNPGGGAGWIEGGNGAALAPGAKRTMDVGAAIGRVARVLLEGPGGPLKAGGQAALDMARKAANKFLAKQIPSGAFGGGQALAEGKGIDSAAEFIPFWNQINPSLKEFANAFSKIVPAESTWNPRASNGSHFGWYQFDAPTWSDFGSGPVSNAFNPGISTKAAGNVAEREGWPGVMSRWAQTWAGKQLGGLVGMQSGGAVGDIQDLYDKLGKVGSDKREGRIEKEIKRLTRRLKRKQKSTGKKKLDLIDQQGAMKEARSEIAAGQKDVNVISDMIGGLEIGHGFTNPREIDEILATFPDLHPDADSSSLYLLTDEQRATLTTALEQDYEVEASEIYTEGVWNQKLLQSLVDLRAKMLAGLKQAEDRMHKAEEQIRKAEREKKKIEDEADKIQKRIKKLHKDLLDLRAKKPPKRNKGESQKSYDSRLKSWREQHAASVDLVGDKIAKQRFGLGQANRKANYFGQLISTARENKGEIGDFKEETLGELEGVQGPGRSMDPRQTIRPGDVWTFGGQIRDVQAQLVNLGMEIPVKPNPDFAVPTDADTTQSQIRDLIEEIRRGQQTEEVVRISQAGIFDALERGGQAMAAGLPVFHGGGILPGTTGEERPYVGMPGEGVFTPEQMAAMGPGGDVYILIADPTLAALDPQIRAVTREEFDALGRGVKVGSRTPAARGVAA